MDESRVKNIKIRDVNPLLTYVKIHDISRSKLKAFYFEPFSKTTTYEYFQMKFIQNVFKVLLNKPQALQLKLKKSLFIPIFRNPIHKSLNFYTLRLLSDSPSWAFSFHQWIKNLFIFIP